MPEFRGPLHLIEWLFHAECSAHNINEAVRAKHARDDSSMTWPCSSWHRTKHNIRINQIWFCKEKYVRTFSSESATKIRRPRKVYMSGDAICSLWEVGDTYKSHWDVALKQQGKL
jgi:hypothetical protein